MTIYTIMKKMIKNDLIGFIAQNGGVVRFSGVLKAGFHSDLLKKLLLDGTIVKMERGFYRLARTKPGSQPDMVAASLLVPGGVFCLLTVLSYHEVTTEIPAAVDIAIRRGSRARKYKYPPLRFYRFSEKTWKAGAETVSLDGHEIKMYNLAKTAADCFKFRNRIGLDTAKEALKRIVLEKRVSAGEIMRFAKICRVSRIIKPYLDALL